MTRTINSRTGDQESAELEALLPHRAPMLLLEQVLAVSAQHASALVAINENNLFFIPGVGVPAWTGLEMMGQTAALMAGFQQQQGLIEAHTGFLLGSRRYHSNVAWFVAGQQLRVDCNEDAVVGDNLAMFHCTICVQTTSAQAASEQADQGKASDIIASARLSVFRQTTPSTGKSAPKGPAA